MNSSTDSDPDKTADYVQQLSGCQSQIYGYIYSMLGNADIAWDTLQETNTVLWQKRSEFDTDRPFMPWACGIAFQQVRAARTRLGRDRLMFHDQATLEAISSQWLDRAARSASDLEIAMDGCLKKLPVRHQEMIERYYRHGHSLSAIAQTADRTANAVGVMLHRIRQSLAECIDIALDRESPNERPSEV